jgi:hypothetical protein
VAPAVDLPIARELAVRLSSLVDGALPGDMPPIVRSKFAHRLEVLRAACGPAERTQLEEAVAGLMMRYPSMRGVSQIEAQVMTRAFADDLHGMPLWAIKAAIADIAAGVIPDANPDFAPSAPRLRQIAQDHLSRPAREMQELKKVLSARVELPDDPEMRERVAAQIAAFQKELPRGNRSVYAPPKDTAPKKQAPTAEQLAEHYANHNLGFEPKHQS